ncbi:BMP family lipoprotein [Spiroplasma platyhelix]|uniref:BMP family ABC transporter substrate-binding protein n=1 Tax=Spiroplasma platyhelix PALS-1 TaxID=1276218 RepID=A0A846TXA2_9MOLU|nr:BMP family ABC transporter substrate-binding protein [Spiroplasma platyhelix]MBE4704319.1 hypothetical protein [Spiroplasma platyhelix PALS-1]NKE38691.1 BMP family ABC transporter substrate-binding protein [Spiroplasma platyhelix PALS-1]UJB28901.1 ribose/galactose ABC transporter substrate-binding protein [Spiroplasma platyhelix PALS-1]
MRKTIKIMVALLFASTTSGSIVACTNPFSDSNIFRITIVTDGHTITDHSFNESSYQGALKFKSSFEAWVADASSTAPDELRNKKVVITPIQPATTDLNTLLSSYGQAVVMDSKVTIASGSIQSSALVAAQNGFLKDRMRYIYVDGDTPNKDVSYQNKNLAGLLYKAEQAGLMAALAAESWLIAHAQEYGGYGNLKMSTYGGLNIPAVTNYMYGFYWGIQLLNNSEDSSPIISEIKSWIKDLNPDFDDSQPVPKIGFVELPNQFTNNFDQASSESKSVNSLLVENGANIIFPVAGPQTSDTLSAIQSKRKNYKVIGVDTDQALQYTESADYFLTSALKDISNSVDYMLWRAINYDETPAHGELPVGEQDKVFKEDALNRGFEEKFIGIADNKAISPIYNKVISSPELTKAGGFIEKVSEGWQKVLDHNGDYWIYGKTINPFE